MLKKIKNMKYKFKTDYVYIYYTDDKGTQGKIAYKKGDIVDVFSPLGGNPFSGANVLVEVTPFKAYDVMNKAYKTIRKISIRTAFLEAVNEYQQGRPDVIDKGIKNYRFLKDYIYEYGNSSTGKKASVQYKKGDIIYGQEINNRIVTGFDGKPVPSDYFGGVGYQWVSLPLNVLGSVLEVVPEYQQGRPDTTVIKKYKITKDYDAPFFYQKDLIYTMEVKKPKTYYKDNIVSGTIIENKIINGNYDITAVAEPYDDKKTENEPQPESKQSKIFTTNNILIGLAAIAIIGMGYYIIKK